ncbi:MAG: OmpW family outer membrane protein, partial [Pseudomonadota bacterium]
TVSRTRHIMGALIALGLTAAVVPAHAVQKGDWLIRGGLGRVSPTGESGTVPVVGGKVEAGNSTNLAVNFTYMLSDNMGVELLGALPFSHDITHNSLGKVAETKELPPTLVLLYNFAPKSGVRPYAGVGLNYTTFFSEKTTGALAGTSLKLDDSFGLAVEAGVDVDLNKDWFLNASLWRMNIDTEANSSLLGKFDVAIDPWALFVGLGKRF